MIFSQGGNGGFLGFCIRRSAKKIRKIPKSTKNSQNPNNPNNPKNPKNSNWEVRKEYNDWFEKVNETRGDVYVHSVDLMQSAVMHAALCISLSKSFHVVLAKKMNDSTSFSPHHHLIKKLQHFHFHRFSTRRRRSSDQIVNSNADLWC